MNPPKLGHESGANLASNSPHRDGVGDKEPPTQVDSQEEVNMNNSVFFGALTVAGLAAGAAAAAICRKRRRLFSRFGLSIGHLPLGLWALEIPVTELQRRRLLPP